MRNKTKLEFVFLQWCEVSPVFAADRFVRVAAWVGDVSAAWKDHVGEQVLINQVTIVCQVFANAGLVCFTGSASRFRGLGWRRRLPACLHCKSWFFYGSILFRSDQAHSQTWSGDSFISSCQTYLNLKTRKLTCWCPVWSADSWCFVVSGVWIRDHKLYEKNWTNPMWCHS